ncbi:MAG: hypothetical protein WKF84_23840 [Pyrinomonadaceae bacterium]
MNAENWQQLKDLFHAALDLDAGERAAFLAEACAGHDELRRAGRGAAQSRTSRPALFLASPALVDAGIITAGEQRRAGCCHGTGRICSPDKRIGPYEIMQ